MARTTKDIQFSPSLCVTHDCNLSCVYCYQKHTPDCRMSLETAKKSIDWIFNNVPPEMSSVEIDFIGGEPLLEFRLIKDITKYIQEKKIELPYILFATTNGTLLTSEMKKWFLEHKDTFWLGLSLDGNKATHDHNRCNSFDAIDIDFFRKNWPNQGVKMTLSEYSLHHLAENIKFVHSLGFSEIGGVNLFEGDFDWSKDGYIKILIPQLVELVEFYVANPSLSLNQMFDKHINSCEAKQKDRQKWCGVGRGTSFFDFDGTMYPCTFITPMTFSMYDITQMKSINFSEDKNFFDENCYQNCYIYSICPTCAGANFMANKTFKIRNKSKCRIQKLIALFIADLQAKKIVADSSVYDKNTLYYTIEAIKKIRSLYLDEFKEFL